MHEVNETEGIAKFINKLDFTQLPLDVVHKAKILIIDTIGCMLGGISTTDHAQILLDVIRPLEGKPEATIFGDGLRTTAINAALCNGTNAHALDMDDTHRECFFHVGVASVPSVLAMAEREKRNGKDIITAVVAAYEVAIRLGVSVNPSLRFNGFHNTGTCGTFGGTVGAGKMLDLHEGQLVNALGLAGTQAAGLLQFLEDGDMSKRLHAGKAASNGVLAALLAQKGYTGPHRVLEGRYGFPAVFGREYDSAVIRDGLGERFRILEMGVKLHAACRMTHSPIDATLALVEKYDLKPQDVKMVKIRMGKLATDQIGNQSVMTFLDGQLSGPFCAALAILRRKVGYKDVMEGVIDREVLELTKRIHIVEDQNIGLTGRTAIVEITTLNSLVYSQKIELPKGEPEDPFSDETIYQKFADLASTCLNDKKVEKSIDILSHLEELTDYSILAKELVP